VGPLFVSHPDCLNHLAGPRHPERPSRLEAVLAATRIPELNEALTYVEAKPATLSALTRVHDDDYVQRVEVTSSSGGGRLHPDTYGGPQTWTAALSAAGAGLTAVTELERLEAPSAFCAIRPPGHHATRREAMGFCVLSNIAVTAAALTDRGERVMIFDFDAHHGNGTQDIFYDREEVLFVSIHQDGIYPGTGSFTETGDGVGFGKTLNVPLPAGATGDVYLSAFDTLVAPFAAAHQPNWVLISAGFDGHRDDPITDLGLAAGDFPALTQRAFELVPPGKRIAFLEGGYDLGALERCTRAMLASLADVPIQPDEPSTSGGPGHHQIRTIEQWLQDNAERETER
jgi:acetoin utilization deacetylase AcuC-like enzyme